MTNRTCKTCANNIEKGNGCLALKDKIGKGCFAWMDEPTLEKTLKAIKDYSEKGIVAS